MLRRVPGARSSLGFPDTETLPQSNTVAYAGDP